MVRKSLRNYMVHKNLCESEFQLKVLKERDTHIGIASVATFLLHGRQGHLLRKLVALQLLNFGLEIEEIVREGRRFHHICALLNNLVSGTDK